MNKKILQHDEKDCGVACLGMIFAFYGSNISPAKIREITRTDRNGTNIYGIVSAAQQIGLNAEPLKGNMHELTNEVASGRINLPFIAHGQQENGLLHYVVVKAFKGNKVIIIDPSKGKGTMTKDEFESFWDGYIIAFSKRNDYKPVNNIHSRFTDYFKLLKGQIKHLIGVLILSFVITLIGIAGTFVFESVLDSAPFSQEEVIETDNTHHHETNDHSHNILNAVIDILAGNSNGFSRIFIVLIAMYLFQSVLQFGRRYLIADISKKIDIKLVLSYYNHVIDLPVFLANTRNTGEYLSRFSDAVAIRNAVAGATLALVFDSFMIIVCGIILFTTNFKMSIVALLMVLLYSICLFLYRQPLKSANQKTMENNAKVESYLKESIDGLETIKSNMAETCVKEKNSNLFSKLIKTAFRRELISASQETICDLIELVGTLIILWIGFGLVLQNVLSVGELITFYALLAYAVSPVKNIMELQPLIQTAAVAADRLSDVLDISSEDNNCTGSDVQEEKNIEKIEFSHVNFRYGYRDLTLKDISFTINKGEKIAIIGESGSGKTTIAKLLMKFYTSESGTIVFNGDNIDNIPAFDIRRRIAYVDQNTFLFSDSILNNLRIGNPSASEEDVMHACKLARIDDFIEKLPYKLNTFLDENGRNLSGGQRQRLALARALLRKPDILILDEATSNLDLITEEGIKETIFSMHNKLTCLIIAHRLSTIKECDQIIVMDDGKIIEMGTHSELLALNGKYKQYINSKQ